MSTQHSGEAISAGLINIPHLLRQPETGVLVAFFCVYAFFAYFTSGTGFVSINGTAGWLNLASQLGIIAVAIGMLMISGEFDLSIGSVLGVSSIAIGVGTTVFGVSIWLMVPAVLAFSLLVGFINGMIVVRTGLPSFIVTLATLFSLAGAALGLSRLFANTTTVSVVSDNYSALIFAGKFGQASVSILWWVAATAIGTFVLKKTVFGNWIYATGGNITAARGAGVPTSRVKIVLFMATAFSASLVGIMQAIEFNSGNAANGQGYVFQAPIVAVIGGVLLGGGYGSALGVSLGAAIYGVISVAIFYTGWNTDWVQLFLGMLLLAAVLTNNYFRQLALSNS
ncbi:MAG: ABC transporter permease [Gammaproteobacteria bacterium]|nr:ABC transporter permease [Gammaproteobacteria bacterium]